MSAGRVNGMAVQPPHRQASPLLPLLYFPILAVVGQMFRICRIWLSLFMHSVHIHMKPFCLITKCVWTVIEQPITSAVEYHGPYGPSPLAVRCGPCRLSPGLQTETTATEGDVLNDSRLGRRHGFRRTTRTLWVFIIVTVTVCFNF